MESVNETVQQTFQQSFKNCTDAMADEITVSVSQQTEQVSCMQEMLSKSGSVYLRCCTHVSLTSLGEMIAKRSDEASTLKSSLSEFNTSMTEQLAAVKKQIIAAVAGGQSQCSELTSSITEAKVCSMIPLSFLAFNSRLNRTKNCVGSFRSLKRRLNPRWRICST